MKNRFLHLMLYVSAALFYFAGPSSLHAQVVNPGNGNCTPAPNCVINGDLNPIGPGGCCNMNSSVPNTVPGWYISHGTPSLWSGAPTGGTYGLWMWSYSAQGEGAFTCYNFRQGHTYEICFWVMNTTTVTAGNLMVYAANGLVAVPPVGFGAPVPVPAGGQELINNTFVNSPVWTQVTYFYTPTANYNQLWIYPFMAGPPINNTQYSLAIDLVRVHDVNQQTVDLTIHSSADTITWCESATLCASGSPSGNYYWSPATGLNTTTGPCVVASPCSTTTYTVEADPDLCLNCHSTNSYTIVVVPPDVQAFSNGQVRCGDKIRLWVEPDLPCATIDWYDPLNNYVGSGQSISLPNANPSMSGTYRVEVSYGGCTITKYVTVEVVDCPCEFRPDFRVEGCNPVYFWDFTSGYATAVSWFWDFGDGNTSTLQNPSHVYASAGVYTVCLTVIGKVGKETCCNKICKDIRVCDPPRNPEKALLPEGSSEEPQPPVRLPENHLGSIVQSILLGRVPASKAELTVVPNPATEQAFVTVKNMVKPVVSIMDLNGSVIAAARMQSDGRYLVDLTSLASGMYLVVAEDATGRVTTKLVKN